MKRNRSSDRHLDDRSALDYLEQKLDASARRAAEEHLGRPCAECRERLREVGALLELLRTDDAPAVPAWLHERALSVFRSSPQPSMAQRALGALATLVFDSLADPLPAAARRSVGEARRLGFRLDEHTLEVEIERESAQTVQMRGWLDAPDAALYAMSVSVGGETRRVQPDGDGGFVAEGIPTGAISLHVQGPGGAWQLPVIEG